LTVKEESLAALEAHAQRSQEATREALELAFARVRLGNTKMVPKGTRVSATSVAKEAGVDRVTLYRFHQPVLLEIRKFLGKTPNQKLQASREALSKADDGMRELRRLAEDAQEAEGKLARINHRLAAQVAALEEQLAIRDKKIEDLQRRLAKATSVGAVVEFPNSGHKKK
jgi:hypothetical protein